MPQLPAILQELNRPKAPHHIGGIGSILQPLCKKFSEDESEDEMDLLGWIPGRSWQPDEKFCTKCAELYRKGLAWKLPSGRE